MHTQSHQNPNKAQNSGRTLCKLNSSLWSLLGPPEPAVGLVWVLQAGKSLVKSPKVVLHSQQGKCVQCCTADVANPLPPSPARKNPRNPSRDKQQGYQIKSSSRCRLTIPLFISFLQYPIFFFINQPILSSSTDLNFLSCQLLWKNWMSESH